MYLYNIHVDHWENTIKQMAYIFQNYTLSQVIAIQQ